MIGKDLLPMTADREWGRGKGSAIQKVDDYYVPNCPPCIDEYVERHDLTLLAEGVIRYGIEKVVVPRAWLHGDERVHTTQAELAARLRTKSATLRRVLAELEAANLIEQHWSRGHGGWFRVIDYSELVEIPAKYQRIRARAIMERERISRRTTFLPDGSTRVEEGIVIDRVTMEQDAE